MTDEAWAALERESLLAGGETHAAVFRVHRAAIEAAGREALAEALRVTYDTADGMGWRLVLMSEDGGVVPTPLSDAFIDAVYARSTSVAEERPKPPDAGSTPATGQTEIELELRDDRIDAGLGTGYVGEYDVLSGVRHPTTDLGRAAMNAALSRYGVMQPCPHPSVTVQEST